MNIFTKTALVAGVLIAMSAPAYAVGTGSPFTVNDGAVAGGPVPFPNPTPTNSFSADSFDFSYKATIIQTNNGGGVIPLDGDSFTESGFLEFSSYKLGATTPPTLLNSLPSVGGYGAYGLFTLDGGAFANPSGITANFMLGTSDTLELWVDPFQNTLKSNAGVVISGGSDDQKIGSASMLTAGEAHLFAGLANGDFEVVWSNWVLTAFGSSYWTNPAPFHTKINLNGNTTTVNPAGNIFTPFTTIADGSGNAFFASAAVPEPGSLVLLGVGLLGFGAVHLRKRKSA